MVFDNERRADAQLRPIAESDLDIILSWRNSERIRSVMFSNHVISSDEHRSWFESLNKKDASVFLLFEYERKPAGLVYFTDIDRANGTCYWGFYLGSEDLPAGTGSLLGVLGIDYAFEQLRMRKICGKTFAYNTGGVKFHRKLGFHQEGRLVKHFQKNGKFEDVIFFSLFKEDWDRDKNELSAPGAR